MTQAEEAAHLASVARAKAQNDAAIATAQASKDAAKARLEAAGFNIDLLDDIKKLIS